MDFQTKKVITIFLVLIGLFILLGSCNKRRGYYDDYGHYHRYHGGSSFFFWGGVPRYYGNDYNRNNRQDSYNGNRRYSGSGGYKRGK